MPKINLSKVEGTIECEAKDAFEWLTKEGVKVTEGGPKAIAALGVLLGAVDQELSDASTGNVAAAIEQIKPVWNDVKTFLQGVGIKL